MKEKTLSPGHGSWLYSLVLFLILDNRSDIIGSRSDVWVETSAIISIKAGSYLSKIIFNNDSEKE